MTSLTDCRCEKKSCGCTTAEACRCGARCACEKLQLRQRLRLHVGEVDSFRNRRGRHSASRLLHPWPGRVGLAFPAAATVLSSRREPPCTTESSVSPAIVVVVGLMGAATLRPELRSALQLAGSASWDQGRAEGRKGLRIAIPTAIRAEPFAVFPAHPVKRRTMVACPRLAAVDIRGRPTRHGGSAPVCCILAAARPGKAEHRARARRD